MLGVALASQIEITNNESAIAEGLAKRLHAEQGEAWQLQLADALDTFWNASLGVTHQSNDWTLYT
jgi:hypothetical protein